METMEKSCTELENEINLWKGKEWEGPWIDLEEGVNDEYRWVKLEDLMSGEIEGAKIVDGLGGSMMRMLKMWEDTGGPEDWDDWWV